jgi:RNA polymerase sigma-70 factor, ECF subfamily
MTDSSSIRVPFRDDGRRVADALSSAELIHRARDGDRTALDVLFARYLPALRRWASGRLPQWSRDGLDTVDLVQETMVKSLKHVNRFECRGQGALLAYLRQGVLNQIKDQKRNATRRPPISALDSAIQDDAPSPVEEAIGEEAVQRYETALARLKDEEQQAVIARLELGHNYAEIATLLNKPSRDAARMLVARALVKLAQEMEREERGGA